jgi:hypothetical protein
MFFYETRLIVKSFPGNIRGEKDGGRGEKDGGERELKSEREGRQGKE